MSEKQAITEFCHVTGANEERAKFFIEASGGNLELALESFFEHGDGDGDDDQAHATNVDIDDEEYLTNLPRPARPTRHHEHEDEKPTKSKPSAPAKAQQKNQKINTLSGLQNDEDNSDSGEEGQAFYAGGSTTSGQQILGPSKKDPNKIVKDLFKKAKEHGAEEVDESEESDKKRGPVVYGSGYRLGDGSEPSEVIKGPSKPKPPKVNVLKLWKNGFTIDNSSLRPYEDAENKEFLKDIQRGVIPQQLIKEAEGAKVNLDMQDHRDEDFIAPKEAFKLYNTEGHKLGSPTPKIVTNASPSDVAQNEYMARENLKLNETQPTTQLQIRLSDGSRVIIKANQTHKISDIREYILTARPEYRKNPFTLSTSFPNKEITNEVQTLKDANLLNAVLILKLT